MSRLGTPTSRCDTGHPAGPTPCPKREFLTARWPSGATCALIGILATLAFGGGCADPNGSTEMTWNAISHDEHVADTWCNERLRLARCGSRCADVRYDERNCGACGNVCTSGTTCTDGICSPTQLGSDHRDPGYWTERGSRLGGRLSAILASPSSSSTLYVASPGGGIWGSFDNGLNWKEYVYGMADLTVLHLAYDLINSSRIFAMTYSDLYASTNPSAGWANLSGFAGYPAPNGMDGQPPDPRPFAQLTFSGSSRVVFWARPCDEIYYSYDLVTFNHLWIDSGGSSNPQNCVVSMARTTTPPSDVCMRRQWHRA